MEPLKPAFNLLGDGPRFLQDLEPLEGKGKPPDMLFIDSAGKSTAEENRDLMVRRGRYPALPLPLAAMALYTLQAFAPEGGRGYLTSMRGGGPMVTLVKPPEEGLWPLVWANVPRGDPLRLEDLDRLPWMRPTKSGIKVPGKNTHSKPHPEVFFGQPRRLRLEVQQNIVTHVIQRRRGADYEGWIHPLTPYYRKGGDWLPLHPKSGNFGYRNWRGVILKSDSGLRRPLTLLQHLRDIEGARCSLIVAGWIMKNAKPLDFLWSEQPVFPLSDEDESYAEAAVEAAEGASGALAWCVRDAVGKNKLKLRAGESLDKELKSGVSLRARESFFVATQGPFEQMLASMSEGSPFEAVEWVRELRAAALPIFDREVLPGLADLGEMRRAEAIVARSKLKSAFGGWPPFGKKIFDPLGLERPPKRRA